MLKVLSLLLLVLGAAVFYSGRPTEVHLAAILADKLIHTNQLASFSFCDEKPLAWDSILVLKPYCPTEALREFGIDNYLAVKMFVPGQDYNDFTCTLIFLEKNSCVGYSVIPRQIVDLVGLANEKNFNMALITRATCVKKLRRDPIYGGVSMVER